MEAIKKKMQAMRVEKENAFDRADQLEQRLVEQKYIYDKVSSCIRHLHQPPPSPHHHHHCRRRHRNGSTGARRIFSRKG